MRTRLVVVLAKFVGQIQMNKWHADDNRFTSNHWSKPVTSSLTTNDYQGSTHNKLILQELVDLGRDYSKNRMDDISMNLRFD